ncbi:MAG: hypothetical protein G01um10148_464 [Parcubacteria group bacterium Gr01-1014_8]|nr:MAG: hypothetical protein G01um10148_464 [Parcubacteria group bacterium Gr01-1014_8]
MVVQKAIANLKDKSKDEKKAVASGIAIGVVAILLIGWGFLFVKKIQQGGKMNLGGGRQAEFDFSSVRDAQEQLKQGINATQDELRAIRESAVSNQAPTEQQVDPYTPEDQFGTDGSL